MLAPLAAVTTMLRVVLIPVRVMGALVAPDATAMPLTFTVDVTDSATGVTVMLPVADGTTTS